MDKAIELGKTSATGSFQLFVGVVTSTVIMAVGTIILGRLLSPSEYGLYSVALIPTYLIILFRDWGINSAITRYVASLRAENKEEDVQDIITTGLIFEATLGLILSLLSILIANFIAMSIFHRPEATFLMMIASTTIFSGALLTAAQSSFIGFERMELNSFTTIFQASIKTVISPLLVYFGYSDLGAILGYTLSFLLAGIIGITLLYIVFLKRLKRRNPNQPMLTATLKKMLHYGVPLSISSILVGFLIQFYAFMMAIYCTDFMIGNYQIATQFATILTFFTIPISTTLFPTFSKINPQKEHELLQTVFAASVKYTAVILIPATAAVIALSKPMIYTLLGENWTHAPLFLSLYVVGNLFVGLGSLSLGNFLAGVGETKVSMKLNLLSFCFGVPLAFLLVPNFGIVGVILGSLFATIPKLILGLVWIWRHYQVKADFSCSTKILASSGVSAAATYLFTSLMGTPEWIKLAVGGATFLTLYLIITPLIRAVNKTDIKNLRNMLSDLGIISKILHLPLSFAEKIAKP
jgi:O-antigen/teichoic acid export membrane protein